jgi:2-amino-4-hydroxy-6-hydroxymethyldihydropteridine diphosphokinase
LGSNRGDRRAHLEGAVAALRSAPSLRVLAVSRWIETEPVGGPPGQRRFLNGVLALETALAPAALLDLLQEIERAHGRRRVLEVRHGPRTLDLDLLLHGRRRIVSERLTLPHPGLEQRLFVLRPLAEIAPGLVLPRSRLTVLGRLGELERAARRSTGLAGLAGAGA